MRRAFAVFLTFVIAFNGFAAGVMAGQMGLADAGALHARVQVQQGNPPCHDAMPNEVVPAFLASAPADRQAQVDCKVCCAWNMVSIASPSFAARAGAAPAALPQHRPAADTAADLRASIKPPCFLT